MSNQTLYDILEISSTATIAEIKQAYRKKCMKYHPDSNPDVNNKTSHEMMCIINEAYSILRNTESRMAYDATINSKTGHDDYTDMSASNEQSSNDTQNNVQYSSEDIYDNIYKYYNSFDFDEDMQEEFINWMEEYAYSYLKFVYEYYKNYRDDFNTDKIPTKIYNIFMSNIENEKNNQRKKSKNIVR